MEQIIQNIQQLIANELHDLEIMLETHAQSKSELANSVLSHILSASSKRIRPIVTILSALAHGFPQDQTEHLELACIIEYLHTASLLHDDVIDNSTVRRGKETAHTIWGNTASILAGDFLHAKAFQLTTDLNNYRIQRVLADTTEAVIEGELEHLYKNRNLRTSKFEYLNIISAKTAKLFMMSSQLGCMLASEDENGINHMAEYGHHLGMIFQIIDDCLDYDIGNQKMGKNTGQDIQEGKPTLPIILAYQNADPHDQTKLETMFRDNNTHIEDVMPYIEKTNALELCYTEAETAADLCRESLQSLPQTQYKNALEQLIDFALQRKH